MNVAMHDQDRLKAVDQPIECDKTDVGGILRFGEAEGRRVRDENVKLAPAARALQPNTKLEMKGAPPHLGLRILVGPDLVAKTSPEPGDSQPPGLGDPPVDVVAALRACLRLIEPQRRPRRVRQPQARVVVARYVKERNVEAADQVFEVVEWEVAARKHDVRAERCELIAVQRFIDLISDCEYSRQGFGNVPSDVPSVQADTLMPTH